MNLKYLLFFNFLLFISCDKDLSVPIGKGNYINVGSSEISSITTNSAKCSFVVKDFNGEKVIEQGICWDINQNPTPANNKNTFEAIPGTYIGNLTNLTPNKTYYVRPYIKLSTGTTMFGDQKYFVTKDISTASFQQTTVTNITKEGAQVNIAILDNGGAPLNELGIVYSTNSNPTLADTKISIDVKTNTFTIALTGLKANTTYYVRPYAINSKGISLGNILQFQTSSVSSGLKQGLVMYFPFSGNALDQSPNKFTSNVTGATLTTDRKGINNQAYSFGDNQQIQIINSESQNLFPLTISLWYYVNELYPAMIGKIISKYVSASWNGVQIMVGDYTNVGNNNSVLNDGFGTTPWYLRGINDRIIGYYGEPPFMQKNILAKTWYHFVFVVDNTGSKIYVNNNLISTDTWTGSFGNTQNGFPWIIGGVYDNKWFNGKVDDVGIWNRSLSSDEIKFLYENNYVP